MGSVAITTIIATGSIDICFLVGSPTAFGQRYGRLLSGKNRVRHGHGRHSRHQPFSADAAPGRALARGRLARNSLAEAALGVMAIAIVGALGTLPPAGTTRSEERLEHMH